MGCVGIYMNCSDNNVDGMETCQIYIERKRKKIFIYLFIFLSSATSMIN